MLFNARRRLLHADIYGYAVNFYVPLGAGQVKSICIANGVLTGTGEGDAQAKSVQWNQSVKCWLNPETVAAVRERIAKKAAAFHAEVGR